jgi:hypothetical protein
MSTFKTDIELGKRYRDTQTGIEGVAVSIHFYQHACERVVLEYVEGNKVEEVSFDVPRLQSVETGKVAKTNKTGGPARSLGRR